MSPTHSFTAKEREKRIREMSLDCILNILKSLSRWFNDLQISGIKNTDLSFVCDNGTLEDADSPNQIVQVKQQKSIIEHGIELFSKKPKQGLKFLHEKGFVGDTIQDIAAFLHSEERLDKTSIGDYLGEGDECVFNLFLFRFLIGHYYL